MWLMDRPTRESFKKAFEAHKATAVASHSKPSTPAKRSAPLAGTSSAKASKKEKSEVDAVLNMFKKKLLH